jgi:hypothetical protein
MNQAATNCLASERDKPNIAVQLDRSSSHNQWSGQTRHVSFVAERLASPTSEDHPYLDDRWSGGHRHWSLNRSSSSLRYRTPSPWPIEIRPNNQNSRRTGRNQTRPFFHPQIAFNVHQTTSIGCYRCGRQHSQTVLCRAMGSTCFMCSKLNHFRRVCQSAQLNAERTRHTLKPTKL